MKKRQDGRYVATKVIKGKRYYFYGNSRKDAQAKADAFNPDKPQEKTFLDAAEEWYDLKLKTCSPNIMRCYGAPYKRIAKYFGSDSLSDINDKDISDFINMLVRQQYSYKTIKTHRQILHNITGIRVEIPKGLPQTKRELPSDEEIEKIKNSVDCHFGMFAYFVLYTGCRRGEALAAKYEDIKNGSLSISHAVYYMSNKPLIKSPKTSAGIREVTIPDCLMEKLTKKKGYIFGNGLDPMTEMAFRRAWERYKKESGVTITPHQIRHAYCTLLYDAGMDLKTAQYLMGHSDLKVTLGIYTHLSNTRQKKTQDILKKLK